MPAGIIGISTGVSKENRSYLHGQQETLPSFDSAHVLEIPALIIWILESFSSTFSPATTEACKGNVKDSAGGAAETS